MHDDITAYSLTPWCRVLLEKLTGFFQLVKKFPGISRNPKVHYRNHKRPPTVSILGQLNPIHIPTSDFLEIHPNFTHPSTPRSPQWTFTLTSVINVTVSLEPQLLRSQKYQQLRQLIKTSAVLPAFSNAVTETLRVTSDISTN